MNLSLSRKQKAILILSGVIFLLWGWHYLFRLPLLPARPMEAVSINAPAFVQFENWFPLRPHSDELAPAWLQQLPKAVPSVYADLLLVRNALQKSDFPDKPASAVWVLQNPERRLPNMLVIIDLRRFDYTIDSLLAHFPQRNSSFKGHKIYRLETEKGRRIAAAQYRNLLLLASQQLQIEEAIGQLSSPRTNIFRDAGFRRANRRPHLHNWCSLYLHTTFLSDELTGWVFQKGLADAEVLEDRLSWLRLDLSPNGDGIQLNGWWAPSRSDLLYTSSKLKLTQPTNDLLRVLPGNTAAFSRFFARNWTGFGARFSKYIRPWLGQEAALVVTEPIDGDVAGHRFVVLSCRDKDLAARQLNALLSDAGQLHSYDYQTFNIRQLQDDNILSGWKQGAVKSIVHPWIVVIDNFVVMAADRAALEVWIDLYLVGNTLGQREDYLQIYQVNRGPGSSMIYLNAERLIPLLKTYTDAGAMLDLARAIGQIQLTFTTQGGAVKMQGQWAPPPADQKGNSSAVVWKTILGAPTNRAPQAVALGEGNGFGIALQDTTGLFYWIGSDGTIQWKQRLDGPVLSKIYALTLPEAARPLLLFNTSQSVYLLTTEGEPVNHYPFHLQSPATNGLIAVDFDKTLDYSYFLSCANGNVYGYNLSGNPLEGWNPLSGIGPLAEEMIHFQKKDKDYLIAFDKGNGLHFLRKDATPRFNTLTLQGNFTNRLTGQLLPDTSKLASGSRVVLVDHAGTATVVNLEGQTFKLRLAPEGKGPVHFAFGNFMGDSRYDYASQYDSTLAVYAYEGSRFAKYTLQSIATGIDDIFPIDLPGEPYAAIGAVSSTRGLIYLFDAGGKLKPGFPLGGGTAFSIVDLFGNGQQILIVANGDSVYAYRIH